MNISDKKAREIAARYHSPAARDRNITAVSHGLQPPDGVQGLVFEVERDLRSLLGDDPENNRELRQLLEWAEAL